MKAIWRTIKSSGLFALLMTVAILLAATTQGLTTLIWVGGTQAGLFYPTQDPNDPGYNALSDPLFDGVDQQARVLYPRTMGVLTYPYTTPYDDSVNKGAGNTYDTVIATQNADPGGKIILTGVSQGGDAVSRAVRMLEENGIDTSNITIITQGNIASSVGGLETALPFGYVPFIGMTLGDASYSTKTATIQVRNQYDLAVDVPQYLNPFSIANVVLGFTLYHTHEYAEPLHGSTYILTTSRSDLVTDVFVPYRYSVLPLLRPLEDLGVPSALLQAINQPMKDLIELGYDRSFYGVPGGYPEQPVRLGLLPPLRLLIPGFAKFVADSIVAAQQMVAMAVSAITSVVQPNISPRPATTSVVPASDEQTELSRRQTELAPQTKSTIATPDSVQQKQPDQSNSGQSSTVSNRIPSGSEPESRSSNQPESKVSESSPSSSHETTQAHDPGEDTPATESSTTKLSEDSTAGGSTTSSSDSHESSDDAGSHAQQSAGSSDDSHGQRSGSAGSHQSSSDSPGSSSSPSSSDKASGASDS